MRLLGRFYRKHPDVCFVLLLCALVACAFWKLILTRQFTFVETPDIVNVILPWLEVQARALRHGTVALWNPFMYAGQPLLGQLQPGVANPLTYLLLALPLRDGQLRLEFIHLWFVLIHLLAAVFAYACCRDIGCRPPGAMLGGLFYSLSGYVGNVTTPPYLLGVMWTPLAFLFLFRSLRGVRPLGSAAMCGSVLGLTWLSGHHQTAYFLTMAVAGVFLCAIIASRKTWLGTVRSGAVCMAIMALVSCVQMLPAIEYGRHAVRWVALPEPVEWNTQVPYEAHQNNSLPASELPFLILPLSSSTLWNPTVGLVALSLVVFALAATFNLLLTRILAGAALAALLFAMARYNPLHGILYVLMPGLDKARSPAVALSVMNFALSPLVALGADRLLSGLLPARWLWRAAKYLAWFAAGLLVAVLFEAPAIRRADHGLERCAMIALIGFLLAAVYAGFSRLRVTAGLAAIFLTALLLLEVGTNIGFDYPAIAKIKREDGVLPRLTGGMRDLVDFVRALPGPKRIDINYNDFLFNFGDWFGIEVMSGFVPSVPASLHRLTWWEPRILSLYGVNYSITSKPPLPWQREIFTSARGLHVYANAGVMPRAWTVHRLQSAGEEEAVRLVRQGSFDFRQVAVLTGPAPAVETCGEMDAVSVDYLNIQRLRLRAEMQCRGMVIVGDNAFPGWQASVDGRPAVIYAANTALRGVIVDKGVHKVDLEYRPASVRLGLVLTLAGVTLAFFMRMRREARGTGILDDFGTVVKAKSV